MANPIFQALNHNSPPVNPQMQNLRQAYQVFQNKGNPMQVFQQIASSNPQMKEALQMLNGGMSSQQVFNVMCQKMGVNPQEFIKMITG